MRPDQQRVQTLLTDTVTLLCRNGLQYNKELKVQGLLGITLDDDEVFIVHINKVFDEVQGKVSDVQSDSGSLMNAIGSVTSLNSFNQFENVDGLSFEDENRNEPVSNGMQLPVIHAQQTSILNRSGSSSKIGQRGLKRAVGAARRKDSRSVKQRLASSFSREVRNDGEIHHVQVNDSACLTPEYQEIHIKDEPPDQLIITESNEIQVDDAAPNDPHPLPTSVQDSSSSHESYAPSQHPLVMYESLEDCDDSSSPAPKSQDADCEQAVDMIECLLYNEGVGRLQQPSTASGMYKNIHISDIDEENSPQNVSDAGTDSLNAACPTWEETVEFSSTEKNEASTSRMPELKWIPSHSQFIHFNITTKRQFHSPLGRPVSEEMFTRCKTVRRQRHRRPVESEEKPFTCPFEGCGLKYYRKDNMIRHHLIKHGTKLKLT